MQEQFGGTVDPCAYEGILPASMLCDLVTDARRSSRSDPLVGAPVTVVLRDLVEAGVAVWSFTTARVFLKVIVIQV